jgi:imidazole glycerol-phosphate synthase subunit HisF
MLKTRIIPTLLIKNMGLVKDAAFKSERRVGSILPQIKIYNLREVDELIVLDIAATKSKNEIDFNEISELSKYNFIPLTVGGGITKLTQIEKLLSIGADKVCVNTIAYKDCKFIKEAVYNFGSQCIVGSVDYKFIENKRVCFSHSGLINENRYLENWMTELEQLGVGELLVTSIDLDGTMKGYDIEMLESSMNKFNLPIICAGGCGSYKDMLKAIKSGCDAVAAASIFHFTEQTPAGAKSALAAEGVPVRKSFVAEAH